MCGTKRLNPFFRLHNSFSPGLSLVALFWVKYGVKTRLACAVAKAADIQWSKMLTTARVKLEFL